MTSTVNVYELLGAEVYLYFDVDKFPMIARVNPRTTASPGDEVTFALDVEKIHVFDKETTGYNYKLILSKVILKHNIKNKKEAVALTISARLLFAITFLDFEGKS